MKADHGKPWRLEPQHIPSNPLVTFSLGVRLWKPTTVDVMDVRVWARARRNANTKHVLWCFCYIDNLSAGRSPSLAPCRAGPVGVVVESVPAVGGAVGVNVLVKASKEQDASASGPSASNAASVPGARASALHQLPLGFRTNLGAGGDRRRRNCNTQNASEYL